MAKLALSKQPEVWFIELIDETRKGVNRARLVSNQQIPLDEEKTDWAESEDSFYVRFSDDIRKGHGKGVVFACTKIVLADTRNGQKVKPSYWAPGNDIFPVTTMAAVDTPTELIDAWEAFQSNKTPKLKKVIAPVEIMEPKENSTLAKLLKDHPCPTPEGSGFYVDPLTWSRVIFAMDRNHNILFTGHSGTGKTELTYLIAKSFKMEMKAFDMGAKQDPISSLIGVHRHNTEKGGSYFDRADFTYAIETPNLILLDELSRAPLNTNNILFPLLDSRRELQMDLAAKKEDRVIKLNKGVRIFATANEGTDYAGTSKIDQALKERFKLIKMNYLPADIEISLLKIREKISKKDGEKIVAKANIIRTLYKEGDITSPVSMRHTLYASELFMGGFSLPEALQIAFLPNFADEEEEAILDVLAAA